ncbi:MAG TPA: DUF5060 domain-containing protein [Asticcacaulis sp.]|nr:DUF5060 domain-containing protein [Asticcacaulis sp.]
MAITRRTALAAIGATGVAGAAKAAVAVERWGVFELTLSGPKSGNPFVDVTLDVEFRQGPASITVPGFYDGDGVYRVRFSPDGEGAWTYATRSNAKALNGKTGSFTATAPSKGNHGPVRITAGYHFAHADGTPFRQIGTTCYSWAQQSDAKCAQTIATLKASPFNKMRMLVFPNVAAEPIKPYIETGSGPADWDPERFNPVFFQKYDDRVRRLGEIGVQADVILFHPYDAATKHSAMSRAHDELYLRYLIARLSAYRHVWWSLANEFDGVKTKQVADWDHIGDYIARNDPHQRLRSIHNEKVFYDNRKAWVTHSSVQNGTAVTDDTRAEVYRSVWEKPVIFDEVCYEGHIKARWGQLSGEELVSRFWHGTVAGTYVGHSEVLDPADQANTSWLGQGGTLAGTSASRLAFLKSVLEAGPVPGIEPIDKWWDRHIGGQAGKYYLRYFGSDTPTQWQVALPKVGLNGGETFRADILDTWNMTVTPVDGTFTLVALDTYTFGDPTRLALPLPGKPWQAVRLTRV